MEIMRTQSTLPLRQLCAEILDCPHSTPTWTDQGVIVLRNQNIRGGRLDVSEPSYTDEDNFAMRTQRALPVHGDLVITREAPMGEVCMIPSGLRCCLGQRMVLLRPNRDTVEPRYLHYAIQSSAVQSAIRVKGGTGSTVSNLRIPVLAALEIPIPPTIAEQEAIAEALSDTDALIESLQQLLVKKRQLKQGTMQELLTGKKRLPGFSGEWEVKRLGELGSFLKGSGVKKDESSSGALDCIRYGEIYTRHDDYIKTFYSRISPRVADTATRLRYGDILFAGSGETKEEIGKCVAFVGDTEAYAGGDIVILRTVDSAPLFLGYYLNTETINRQKASKGQGDAVVHINAAALAHIHGVFPSVPEQTAIATILSDMDTEITALESKLTKTCNIKQGMMQELLTGRIRLV